MAPFVGFADISPKGGKEFRNVLGTGVVPARETVWRLGAEEEVRLTSYGLAARPPLC